MPLRRRNFDVPGYRHGKNPIPAVARVGNVIMTGGISGVDLATGLMPERLEEQCANMFDLVRKLAEAAGASLDDIVKITVFMKPPIDRTALNAAWVASFPDATSRPVRHLLVNEHLASGMLVQCDFVAVAPDQP